MMCNVLIGGWCIHSSHSRSATYRCFFLFGHLVASKRRKHSNSISHSLWYIFCRHALFALVILFCILWLYICRAEESVEIKWVDAHSERRWGDAFVLYIFRYIWLINLYCEFSSQPFLFTVKPCEIARGLPLEMMLLFIFGSSCLSVLTWLILEQMKWARWDRQLERRDTKLWFICVFIIHSDLPSHMSMRINRTPCFFSIFFSYV